MLASVTDWAGEAVAPVGMLMLPELSENATNAIVVGVLLPAGFVGSGDGAPTGALRLLVALMEVPLAIVVPLWNVTLAVHEPSAGKFAAVPATGVRVPVAFPETVPHGNVAVPPTPALPPAVDVGAGEGLLVPPPHPATAATKENTRNEVPRTLMRFMGSS